MRCISLTMAILGCSGERLTDGHDVCAVGEVPVSAAAQVPADEATVMAFVSPERVLTASWSIEPGVTGPSAVSVLLSRGAGEATVADRGISASQACEVGSFLRIPYDLEVRIGADDVVASGPVLLQASDSFPDDLFVLTPGSMVFPGDMIEATLSDEWRTVAEAEFPPDWTAWTWVLSHSGPYEAPGLSVLVRYIDPDSDGLRVIWRGDLAEAASP
jgi:hypothetical protein